MVIGDRNGNSTALEKSLPLKVPEFSNKLVHPILQSTVSTMDQSTPESTPTFLLNSVIRMRNSLTQEASLMLPMSQQMELWSESFQETTRQLKSGQSCMLIKQRKSRLRVSMNNLDSISTDHSILDLDFQ